MKRTIYTTVSALALLVTLWLALVWRGRVIEARG